MHLFETKEGDKWVCITCRSEQEERIEQDSGNGYSINMIRCFVVQSAAIRIMRLKTNPISTYEFVSRDESRNIRSAHTGSPVLFCLYFF